MIFENLVFTRRNYKAELFAFGKRLGEEFKMSTLRRAFRHSSYQPPEETAEGEDEGRSKIEQDTGTSQEFIPKGELFFQFFFSSS